MTGVKVLAAEAALKMEANRLKMYDEVAGKTHMIAQKVWLVPSSHFSIFIINFCPILFNWLNSYDWESHLLTLKVCWYSEHQNRLYIKYLFESIEIHLSDNLCVSLYNWHSFLIHFYSAKFPWRHFCTFLNNSMLMGRILLDAKDRSLSMWSK